MAMKFLVTSEAMDRPPRHSLFLFFFFFFFFSADFVAHTAFQVIVRASSRVLMWGWYEQRLRAVIVRDGRGRHGVQGLR